jgi:hypothetical protein
MKGSGMKIYKHQFGLYSENHDISRRNYGNNNRSNVFYHGDLKPIIKIKRGRAKIVELRRVNNPRFKRNLNVSSGPANSVTNISNRTETSYSVSSNSESIFSTGLPASNEHESKEKYADRPYISIWD